jgi:hypothetical protein
MLFGNTIKQANWVLLDMETARLPFEGIPIEKGAQRGAELF